MHFETRDRRLNGGGCLRDSPRNLKIADQIREKKREKNTLLELRTVQRTFSTLLFFCHVFSSFTLRGDQTVDFERDDQDRVAESCQVIV